MNLFLLVQQSCCSWLTMSSRRLLYRLRNPRMYPVSSNKTKKYQSFALSVTHSVSRFTFIPGLRFYVSTVWIVDFWLFFLSSSWIFLLVLIVFKFMDSTAMHCH